MIACLFDIHGNLPALEAVLADAGAQGAERYVLGGDYALFGGWPKETVETLRAIDGAVWIRGNVDRWTAFPHDAPDDPVPRTAIPACREALGEDLVAFLGNRAFDAVIGGSHFVHASPSSDVRSLFPEPAPDEEELLAGVHGNRLVFGHTHLAFRRVTATGLELVNPGSVGMPLDGDPRAAYALLHPDATVEHRRVAYDHGAAIERLRTSFRPAPWVSTVARRLERAEMVA